MPEGEDATAVLTRVHGELSDLVGKLDGSGSDEKVREQIYSRLMALTAMEAQVLYRALDEELPDGDKLAAKGGRKQEKLQERYGALSEGDTEAAPAFEKALREQADFDLKEALPQLSEAVDDAYMAELGEAMRVFDD